MSLPISNVLSHLYERVYHTKPYQDVVVAAALQLGGCGDAA